MIGCDRRACLSEPSVSGHWIEQSRLPRQQSIHQQRYVGEHFQLILDRTTPASKPNQNWLAWNAVFAGAGETGTLTSRRTMCSDGLFRVNLSSTRPSLALPISLPYSTVHWTGFRVAQFSVLNYISVY